MAEKKVALVTGANRGLGFEIARQLAAKGFAVVLGGRELSKAEKAAASLRDEGLDAYAVKLDVTSMEDITALAKFFKDKFGGLDVLVNNAGVAPEQRAQSVENFKATFETNVVGVYAVTQALLPLIKASPSGRIVNQSSILGSLDMISSGNVGPEWTLPGYCASKAALNMLTVALAVQLKGSRVKVNAAHPGWVKTEMGGNSAPLDVGEGAKTAVELATLGDEGPSGAYIHLGKTIRW